jgi:acetylornithine deacetylase
MYDDVLEQIDEQKKSIVEFCQKLIQFDTVTHAEKGQRFVAEHLRRMGLDIDVFEPDNERMKRYSDYGPGNDYKGKPNVVGVLKGSGKGKSLILNAHIDTVSAEPLSSWKHDPFGGRLAENRIFGRGAADDKGDLASVLMAVKAIKESGVQLAGDLIVESVIGEETDGNGTLSCCDRGYKADGAIVVDSIEPSDSVVVAQAGVTYFGLKVKGRSTHLCQKFTLDEGVSAIDKMRVILDGLEIFQKERQTLQDPDYLPKVPIIGVTMISGGGKHSRSTFPEECSVEVEYDYFATEIGEENNDYPVRDRITKRIRSIEKEDKWLEEHGSSIEWLASILPTTIDKKHPLVTTLAKNVESVAGNVTTVPIATSTDARHFQWVAATPVVSWSCGGDNAHGIDESVAIGDLIRGTKILASTILDWCGVA